MPPKGQGVLMLPPTQEGCVGGRRGAFLSGELGSLLKTKCRPLVDCRLDGALLRLLCSVPCTDEQCTHNFGAVYIG